MTPSARNGRGALLSADRRLRRSGALARRRAGAAAHRPSRCDCDNAARPAALTFAMGRLLPADPVIAITGPEVSKEVYDRVYPGARPDRPVWEQFLAYVGKSAAQATSASSTTTGQTVLTDLLMVFPATIELALVAHYLSDRSSACRSASSPRSSAGRYRPCRADRRPRRPFHPDLLAGLMALFLFYAKLDWFAASGRVDVFYEGLVTPMTGFLLLDAAIQGAMGRVLQRARPHHPARRRSSAIIPSPISAA